MVFNWLTKYVVGAKTNPPKNPKRPPKKGTAIAMSMVSAAKQGEIIMFW